MQDARNNPDKYPLDKEARTFSNDQLQQIERMKEGAEAECDYCGFPIDVCQCDDTTEWTERFTGDLNNDR